MGGKYDRKLTPHDLAVMDEAIQQVAERGTTGYDPAFADRAACADADIEVFFPTAGHRGDEARAICDTCPVWLDCLLMSMVSRSSLDFGIYGRLSPPARNQLRRALDIEIFEFNPVEDYRGIQWGINATRAKEHRASEDAVSGEAA